MPAEISTSFHKLKLQTSETKATKITKLNMKICTNLRVNESDAFGTGWQIIICNKSVDLIVNILG